MWKLLIQQNIKKKKNQCSKSSMEYATLNYKKELTKIQTIKKYFLFYLELKISKWKS